MSTRRTSANLAAIVALTGCTAAFLLPSEASATNRFVAARVSRPAPQRVASRPVFHPVQPRITQTFSRPSALIGRPQFRPASISFSRPANLPHLTSFPHPGNIGGGFPHQALIGGHFSHAGITSAHFPSAGSIGGSAPHANSLGGNFPHHASLGTSVGSPAKKQTLGHGFSIGDIPVIGPAVGAATKTVGDIVTGKIQKVPGDIISGPGKVVTGTIGQLTPKPASTSEPQGSTTSDASGFNTGKPSAVQTALLLKQLNDMKAAAAAGSTQGKPSMVQTALLLKQINDMKAAQQASAAKTASNTTTNTTTTSNTTSSKQPGQVFCIVAPCPVIHPGSPPTVTGKNPGGKLNPPVIINVGVGPVGGGLRPNRFPGQGFPGQRVGGGAPLPDSSGSTAQPIAASASSYQATAYQPQTSTPGLNLPAPGSLGTPVAAAAQTPNVTGATSTVSAASNPMFVFVAFQKDVSGTDLATFLQVYKVSIAEGPNADGLYKLQLAEPLAPDVLSQMIDSMKSQTAVVASVAS